MLERGGGRARALSERTFSSASVTNATRSSSRGGSASIQLTNKSKAVNYLWQDGYLARGALSALQK